MQGDLPIQSKKVFERVFAGGPLTDDQARLAHITIVGRKRTSKMSGSSANLESLETVTRILPWLMELYGEQTNSRLLIITPYRRQVDDEDLDKHIKLTVSQLLLYRQRFALLRRSGCSEGSLPRVLTIDSSQGKESEHVIVDLVAISGDCPRNIGWLFGSY